MKNRKWFCVLLSMILMLSSALTAFAGTSLDTALNKVNLYMKAEKGAQLMTWKGIIDADNFATAMIVYETEDGEELPAYCANPDKPGVEEMASHTYDVDVDQLDQNPEVWGVITNGYPYKSPAELGVSTDYEAYYATKMAVWAVVHDNYSDLDDWAANGNQNTAVEQAMKNLVAIGRANEYVYNTWLATTPTSPTLQEEGDYYTQTYELTSNVELESYYIVLSGNVPDGTVVLSESGEEVTEFDGTENSFSIQIPKDSITEEGTFRVLVKATLENKSVMYGNSHDDTQDYYVAPMPTYNGDSWVDIVYSDDEGTPPTTETIDPDEPTTTTTGLNILKVDAGTNDGLSGAVIRVTNATGGVIGTYVTDDSGSINIQDLPTGAYYIEEIVAPDGYVLDENPHQDVVLDEDRDTIVTFANEPESKLEITKVDADTGEKLDGAIFRVALDDGSNSFDVQTDNSGVAYLSNMKSGTYTVTEIVAPDGYLLDDTPQIIKLVAGETATVTMENQAEPGLLVRKVDEDTGMPLANAVFNIAKKGETTIHEMTTDKAGEIRLEGLDEGWYTITETVAPSGYLLETESKDVYLEPNQLVEVMFTNRLRPSLQIMKIDAVTNEPLAGATFKVTKTEDMTVSEYITDSTGTIVNSHPPIVRATGGWLRIWTKPCTLWKKSLHQQGISWIPSIRILLWNGAKQKLWSLKIQRIPH